MKSEPEFRSVPDKPDIAKLTRFSKLHEKSHTMFYAGREDLIEAALDSADLAMEGFRRGEASSGETRIFQGAPGAGKTSLLKEIARDPRTRGCEARAEVLPRIAEISVEELKDETLAVMAIARALPGKAPKRFLRTMQVSAGLAAGFPGASASASFTSTSPPPRASFRQLGHLSREDRNWRACWDRPLVVAVDEIQDAASETLHVLRELHLGEHGLPVVPVYGGLSNSRDVLENEVGLTRIVPEHVVTMERLSPREAERAVDRLLTECGVANRDRTSIREDLAKATSGWPQHLHNGMRVLARMLAKADGDMDKVLERDVLQREMEVRNERHEVRTSRKMKEVPAFVARVMSAALHEDLHLPAVLKKMKDLSAAGREDDERLPESETAESFLYGHLVRKGALQESSEGVFKCPIPCFADYLVRKGGERGKVNVIAEARTPPVPR